MRRRACSALALAAALATAGAAEAQEAPPRAVRFTTDLGFVKTGGNTDLMTLSLGERIDWRARPELTVRQTLSWVYGETDGVESANQLRAGVRGNQTLTDGLSVYGGIAYDYNLFAGIKRRFEESVGLGYHAIDTGRHDLEFEAGLSLFQETTTADARDRFAAGRAAADYKYQFGAKAYFQQTLEMQPNFANDGDYRLSTESVLVAPLNSVLALKVSYVLQYRGEPPAGFGRTDTTFRTGIQVTL